MGNINRITFLSEPIADEICYLLFIFDDKDPHNALVISFDIENQ